MIRLAYGILAVLALVAGCRWQGGAEDERGGPQLPPLRTQQAAAYGEAATGTFVSLADFEDAPPAGRREQVRRFAVEPAAAGAECRYVVTVTRTGIGGLRADLPPGCSLVFHPPEATDFSRYTLLSMAIHTDALRDDFRATLTAAGGVRRRPARLLRPGWNNVLLDIRGLRSFVEYGRSGLTEIRIGFEQASGPVRLHLDDILLIDNRRRIEPTPQGVELRRDGLDYVLTLPGRRKPLTLSQGPDGLWRAGRLQPALQLASADETPPAEGEHLRLLGTRQLGQVEVLEHNAVRVRLANTWRFPTDTDEWSSQAVRRVRWEYTAYADGRLVTHLDLNNAGGRRIRSVRILLPEEAAWPGGRTARELRVDRFVGPVGRWAFLSPPPGADGDAARKNYQRPGRIARLSGEAGDYADGDADRDGFDESQGCYYLRAGAGPCRFALDPPPDGIRHPVFRIRGEWSGEVAVGSEGLAVRGVVRPDDGAVLFVLPGWVRKRTVIEVAAADL